MGTDMHVAIEVKRDEYSYAHSKVEPKWCFIKEWSVDRCYDLFGCFNNVRRFWTNSLSLPVARDMSYHLNHTKEECCYGFYKITPDVLKRSVLFFYFKKLLYLMEYSSVFHVFVIAIGSHNSCN